MKRLARTGLLAGLAAGTGCVFPSSAAVHEGRALRELRDANYERAYDEIQRAARAAPEDEGLVRLTKRLRVLALLDRQRRLIFEGEEEKALAVLARILTIDPRNAVAKKWQNKARVQRGRTLVLEGEEFLKAEDLEHALARFQKALSYIPGDEAALRGLKGVSRVYRSQRDHAGRHYVRALQARQDADWKRVLYHAGTSKDADPTNPDAPALWGIAERRVAEEQRSWAEQQEELGLWGAAARDYTRAAELAEAAKLPWAASAKQRAREMADEARASNLFAKAEVRISAGAFDDARKLVAEGDGLCRVDRVYLNELLAHLERKEVEALYARARLLEFDHRYEEALALYEQIRKRDPDGTAADRVASITDLLASCATQYEAADEAARAGDLDKARGLWKDILAVHPRYRDVRARYDGK